MSDDLIERLDALQRRIFGQSRCNDQDAATVREARSALTAAQARIAKLEADMDAAYECGRLQGLDEAAEYCRTHTMDVVTRSVKADFAGAYIAGPVFDGGKHAGMGYAEAIEALKTKGGE